MRDKIKKHPRLKHLLIGLISSHKHPRPRLWVRWLVNPFVHKKGRGASVRSRGSRHDLFPWHRFEVGKGALVEQFTVLNNGAGDILIGAGARVGIGSVVIGPVRMGERAGLGQHVFVAGFNHGYADPTCDSNTQPLVVREVVIGPESHIGANSVVVAGVHIGERVQIGAGSVVTKDIPSYCVAAGNPARIIKRYDFRRRRWVRVDEQPGADRSGDRNTEQRKRDTRRSNDPSGRANASERLGNGGKSERSELRPQPQADRGRRTPDERSRNAAPDGKPQNGPSATDRARTNSDRQPRNRAGQHAPQSVTEIQQTAQPQTTPEPQPTPATPPVATDAAAQPARRRRNRRKPAQEGTETVNTRSLQSEGTRGSGSNAQPVSQEGVPAPAGRPDAGTAERGKADGGDQSAQPIASERTQTVGPAPSDAPASPAQPADVQ